MCDGDVPKAKIGLNIQEKKKKLIFIFSDCENGKTNYNTNCIESIFKLKKKRWAPVYRH